MIVDTHCHLSHNDYEDLDEIIKHMNGIMITAGCDDESNLEVIDIVKKYPNVYGVLGIHPTELDKITPNSFEIIENNITKNKIVGIGEIGLDYHYGKENAEEQKKIFIKQLELAKKYNVPAVIHSRDSIEDTYNILKSFDALPICILHCYSSSVEMAKEFIKFGVYFGVGGTLTYKNNVKTVELVREIDLKYLLLETDSPYLSPVPLRGKQNEPYNVRFVAEKIAEIKEISVDTVIDTTSATSHDIFDLE